MLPTITVDVGTTSVKLCFFDARGSLVVAARHPTPTLQDPWGEVYAVDELRALVTSFVVGLAVDQRALVRRIAFTGVGESGGLVRPDLSLASPLILWHDHRGAAAVARLDDAERSRVYRVTGLPANANYGLSKVAWALEHAGREASGVQWLNVSEYLAATFTGERWSEPSLASRTMALDLRTGAWSGEVCDLFGVGIDVFPDLLPATEGVPLRESVARELGLPSGVDVHVAGHDHMVGAVGAGLRPGELLNSTGTTEGLLVLRDTPSLDDHAERSKLANGVASTGDGAFTLFASIPTGGSAFATLQGLVGLDAAQLTAQLDSLYRSYRSGLVDPRSAPLVLPQFRGSPPPTKNASARGIIAGVRTDTSVADVVFGTFLGMILQFREVLDLFPDRPERVRVIGPASRNPLWLQLKADLLGRPLIVSRFPEVVSRGAQDLASALSTKKGASAGDSPRRDDSETFEIVPDDRRTALLSDWAEEVRPLWEHLKGAPA